MLEVRRVDLAVRILTFLFVSVQVGVGGEWDATNVITSILAVICSVGKICTACSLTIIEI